MCGGRGRFGNEKSSGRVKFVKHKGVRMLPTEIQQLKKENNTGRRPVTKNGQRRGSAVTRNPGRNPSLNAGGEYVGKEGMVREGSQKKTDKKPGIADRFSLRTLEGEK